MALCVILIRAGLCLDPVALRKLSFGVFRLAFTPCLVETVCAAVASYFILGIPWLWSFMLGFVLAAVSPAIVVPSMLSFETRGYGVDKGIPTLVIAASSVENVLAITGFDVLLGIAFSTSDLAWSIVKGPLEAICGVLYGIVVGLVLWYIPHAQHGNKRFFRFTLLLLACFFVSFASRVIEFSGAGPLGCLTVAFVAALRWRQKVENGAENGAEMEVTVLVGHLWTFFEPLLFGLIGAEVTLDDFEVKTIKFGLAVLAIGLVFRGLTAFFAVFGLGLTLREKIFIPFAWLPKATVQAAIGGVALDTAREQDTADDNMATLGIQVLTVAAVAIVITAPLGAAAIALTGPVLLQKRSTRAVAVAPELEVREFVKRFSLSVSERHITDVVAYPRT